MQNNDYRLTESAATFAPLNKVQSDKVARQIGFAFFSVLGLTAGVGTVATLIDALIN